MIVLLEMVGQFFNHCTNSCHDSTGENTEGSVIFSVEGKASLRKCMHIPPHQGKVQDKGVSQRDRGPHTPTLTFGVSNQLGEDPVGSKCGMS